MYTVNLYTERHGSSSDVDSNEFETFEEAKRFFDDYDISLAWNIERQCSPVGTMKNVVFCAELWKIDEEDESNSEVIDYKEYSYSDYMRSES